MQETPQNNPRDEGLRKHLLDAYMSTRVSYRTLDNLLESMSICLTHNKFPLNEENAKKLMYCAYSRYVPSWVTKSYTKCLKSQGTEVLQDVSKLCIKEFDGVKAFGDDILSRMVSYSQDDQNTATRMTNIFKQCQRLDIRERLCRKLLNNVGETGMSGSDINTKCNALEQEFESCVRKYKCQEEYTRSYEESAGDNAVKVKLYKNCIQGVRIGMAFLGTFKREV